MVENKIYKWINDDLRLILQNYYSLLSIYWFFLVCVKQAKTTVILGQGVFHYGYHS